MDINEIKKLKNQFFEDDDELKKFLITITKELLNSKLPDETLNPTIITHKQFIDISLSRIIKKIKQKLITLAKQKNMPLGDKIFEIKLEYLAGYILKLDLKTNNYIYTTIAKYILNLIKKDYLSLNHFASTLNKETYISKYGKFKYPPLYPFDRNKYNNPITYLKQKLTKIDNIKSQITHKESELNKITSTLKNLNLNVSQIKTAASDMKLIVNKLKEKYENIELKNRLAMIKNQHSRFEVLLKELKEEIIQYKKQEITLSKNINAIKEKYKDTLNEEKEIIETMSNNLKIVKKKI